MRYRDIDRLRSAGYQVIERSPWHFQVIGEPVLINIWPTKRKYMVAFDSGASYYTDIVATVKSILEKAKPRVAPATPEYFAWQEWRFAFAKEIYATA